MKTIKQVEQTPIINQIEEYLEWCEEHRGMTEQTVSSKTYILYRLAKQTHIKDMANFTNKDAHLWIKGMRDGTLTGRIHNPNTCNVRIRTLRAFIRWLNETDTCKVPAKLPYINLIKQEKSDKKFYTRREIEKVLDYSDTTQRAMISLMFESGLRLTEFQNVRISDIDFGSNKISILGKGQKYGTVYFTDEVRFYLRLHIELHELYPSDYLWRSERNGGLPYTRDALRSKMRQAFEKAGFSDFHPHALRHSFATDLVNNKASLQETQALLRHTKLETTEIYIHNLQFTLGDVYNRVKKEGKYGVDKYKIVKE